jgi:hypothetical protein
MTRYGDSAGPNATYYPHNPYGFHGDVSFTTYSAHVADTTVGDEIIY